MEPARPAHFQRAAAKRDQFSRRDRGAIREDIKAPWREADPTSVEDMDSDSGHQVVLPGCISPFASAFKAAVKHQLRQLLLTLFSRAARRSPEREVLIAFVDGSGRGFQEEEAV